MKRAEDGSDLFSLAGPRVGDRVRVKALAADAYAVGAAESLSGRRGIVEERKDVDHYGVRLQEPLLVVRFDEPAASWWTNQRPVVAFWFDVSEVDHER